MSVVSPIAVGLMLPVGEDRLSQLESDFARATSPLMMRSIAADIASLEEDREWSKFEEQKADIEKRFEFSLERLRNGYDECQRSFMKRLDMVRLRSGHWSADIRPGRTWMRLDRRRRAC